MVRFLTLNLRNKVNASEKQSKNAIYSRPVSTPYYFETIGIKSRKLKISKWKIKVYFTTCIQKHIAHQTTKIKKGGEKGKKTVERKCERYSTED